MAGKNIGFCVVSDVFGNEALTRAVYAQLPRILHDKGIRLSHVFFSGNPLGLPVSKKECERLSKAYRHCAGVVTKKELSHEDINNAAEVGMYFAKNLLNSSARLGPEDTQAGKDFKQFIGIVARKQEVVGGRNKEHPVFKYDFVEKGALVPRIKGFLQLIGRATQDGHKVPPDRQLHTHIGSTNLLYREKELEGILQELDWHTVTLPNDVVVAGYGNPFIPDTDVYDLPLQAYSTGIRCRGSDYFDEAGTDKLFREASVIIARRLTPVMENLLANHSNKIVIVSQDTKLSDTEKYSRIRELGSNRIITEPSHSPGVAQHSVCVYVLGRTPERREFFFDEETGSFREKPVTTPISLEAKDFARVIKPKEDTAGLVKSIQSAEQRPAEEKPAGPPSGPRTDTKVLARKILEEIAGNEDLEKEQTAQAEQPVKAPEPKTPEQYLAEAYARISDTFTKLTRRAGLVNNKPDTPFYELSPEMQELVIEGILQATAGRLAGLQNSVDTGMSALRLAQSALIPLESYVNQVLSENPEALKKLESVTAGTEKISLIDKVQAILDCRKDETEIIRGEKTRIFSAIKEIAEPIRTAIERGTFGGRLKTTDSEGKPLTDLALVGALLGYADDSSNIIRKLDDLVNVASLHPELKRDAPKDPRDFLGWLYTANVHNLTVFNDLASKLREVVGPIKQGIHAAKSEDAVACAGFLTDFLKTIAENARKLYVNKITRTNALEALEDVMRVGQENVDTIVNVRDEIGRFVEALRPFYAGLIVPEGEKLPEPESTLTGRLLPAIITDLEKIRAYESIDSVVREVILKDESFKTESKESAQIVREYCAHLAGSASALRRELASKKSDAVSLDEQLKELQEQVENSQTVSEKALDKMGVLSEEKKALEEKISGLEKELETERSTEKLLRENLEDANKELEDIKNAYEESLKGSETPTMLLARSADVYLRAKKISRVIVKLFGDKVKRNENNPADVSDSEISAFLRFVDRGLYNSLVAKDAHDKVVQELKDLRSQYEQALELSKSYRAERDSVRKDLEEQVVSANTERPDIVAVRTALQERAEKHGIRSSVLVEILHQYESRLTARIDLLEQELTSLREEYEKRPAVEKPEQTPIILTEKKARKHYGGHKRKSVRRHYEQKPSFKPRRREARRVVKKKSGLDKIVAETQVMIRRVLKRKTVNDDYCALVRQIASKGYELVRRNAYEAGIRVYETVQDAAKKCGRELYGEILCNEGVAKHDWGVELGDDRLKRAGVGLIKHGARLIPQNKTAREIAKYVA